MSEIESTIIPDMAVSAGKTIFKSREDKAIKLVYGVVKSMGGDFTVDDVKIVWFCKTLQNWKAMVAIIIKDGPFCEVTYNGDKKETYVDVYRRIENVVFPD